MVDLSVKFAGLDFKNPISVAAHGPGIPNRNLLSDKDASGVHMKLWRKYKVYGRAGV